MLQRGLIGLLIGVLCASAGSLAAADGFPKFRHVEIDPNVGKVCYALTLADVDGDGKTDIVAVTENRVLWYKNPTWEKKVILEDQTELDNVCIAPFDIDGDGQIDFALGAGWTKVGTIQWLSRGQSLDDKWHVHSIGAEPWLHRMRFADVLGTGRPQLVISPLNKTQGDGVRLTAFEIPANPKTDRWQPTIMNAELNRMHNHWHLDFDGNGTTDTLTASEEGVSLIRRTTAGSDTGWTRTVLGESGAGEIKTGKLPSGDLYIATVEPMHGTHVVVYTKPAAGEKLWTRHVLDDTLRRGHAVWTADVDGDGAEELVIGHSDKGPGPIEGPGVYIYKALDEAGTKWQKHVIDDGGVAVEDIVAADLTGNGRLDIVAGGRDTHNIKLYVNLGSE
jgi:hypothetical protein